MSPRMKGTRALGAVWLMLALAVPLISQTSTGRIVGTIADQTGAAVAGANVTVTDVQRGTTRTVVADTSGEYLVQPGVYKVRAEAKGFKAVERVDIVVEVAQDLRVDLSLPTGLVRAVLLMV